MPNKITEEEKNNLFEQIEKHTHRRVMLQRTIEKARSDGLLPADLESEFIELELFEVYEQLNFANNEAVIPILTKARDEEDKVLTNLFSRLKV